MTMMDQSKIKRLIFISSALLTFLIAFANCVEPSASVVTSVPGTKPNPVVLSPKYLGPGNGNTTKADVSSNASSKSKRISSASSVIPMKFEVPVPVPSGSKGKGKGNKNVKSPSSSPAPAPNMTAVAESARSPIVSTASLPWPASLDLTRALVNKSLKRLKGKLEQRAAEAQNNRRGSRAPTGGTGIVAGANNVTSGGDSVRSFANVSSTAGPNAVTTVGVGKSGTGKEAKQSWLAVASAVAHSTAAETHDQTNNPLNEDTSSKPTKYHYYPHNQHLYLLPECATQQVCSAVYLRLNYSQPLCACPTFHEPCSVSTRTDDRHTIPLVTGSNSQVLTLVKTCEPTQEVRECRAPKDWSILALQNSRTGKAHYLVICRCPSPGYLEGPIAHSQPAYARVPGIRVYGMTCVRFPNRTGKTMRLSREHEPRGPLPNFPWYKLKALFHSFT